MKYRRCKQFLLLALLLLSVSASAQYRRSRSDNYHFGYVSLTGGFGSISDNVSGSKMSGGFAGSFGLGYEFRRNGFWLSVGGSLQMMQPKVSFDKFVYTPATSLQMNEETGNLVEFNGLTSDNKLAIFHYTIDQKDVLNLYYVDIPLMLGYYYEGFYVGAGAKFGISAWSSISTSADYSISADMTPAGYIGTFEKLHEFQSGHYETRPNIIFKHRWSVVAEIGYDVLATRPTRKNTCHVLKVGVYAEYSINNIVPAGNINNVTFPVEIAGMPRADRPQINPFYLSDQAQSNMRGSSMRVAPFMVGLKLTYMIGGSRSGGTGTWHRGCQCYE